MGDEAIYDADFIVEENLSLWCHTYHNQYYVQGPVISQLIDACHTIVIVGAVIEWTKKRYWLGQIFLSHCSVFRILSPDLLVKMKWYMYSSPLESREVWRARARKYARSTHRTKTVITYNSSQSNSRTGKCEGGDWSVLLWRRQTLLLATHVCVPWYARFALTSKIFSSLSAYGQIPHCTCRIALRRRCMISSLLVLPRGIFIFSLISGERIFVYFYLFASRPSLNPGIPQSSLLCKVFMSLN